jgi:hypothetical protein
MSIKSYYIIKDADPKYGGQVYQVKKVRHNGATKQQSLPWKLLTVTNSSQVRGKFVSCQ